VAHQPRDDFLLVHDEHSGMSNGGKAIFNVVAVMTAVHANADR
jgi:hypothetical protein